jgi:deoxyribonuclease V
MHIHHRHEWTLTPEQAIALQKQLAAEIVSNCPIDLAAVKLVAGVDVSVKSEVSQAAVVVVTFPELEPVETVLAKRLTPFPYIPGLLSFREGPADAFIKLELTPDAFLFDGMGIAHPRRLGIAAQMGLWLQKPTVGCGKSLLVGRYKEPGNEKGAYSDLIDRGEVTKVLRRERVAGIIRLDTWRLRPAVELARRTTKYQLPEPIRLPTTRGKFAG